MSTVFQPARRGEIEALEARRLLAVTVFTIDPARSVVTAGGSVTVEDFGSFPLEAQGSGSLSTSYHGTISADVTPGTITFDGASFILANNSGSWAPTSPPPTPPESPGSAPANYGVQVFEGLAQVAVRELGLNLTSPTLAIATDGSFPSSGQTFTAVQGRGDYYETVTNKSGSVDAEGSADQDPATPRSRYVVDGGVATLTLPIDIRMHFEFGTEIKVGAELRLTGQLVATVGVDGGPVRLAAAYVRGSAWSGVFRDFLALQPDQGSRLGFRLADLGQNESSDTLPWTNLDTLAMKLTGVVPAGLGASSVQIASASGRSYAVQSVTTDPTDPTVALIRLSTPITNDRMRIQLLGVTMDGGSPAEVRLNVLPADVNQSGGAVNAADLVQTRNRVGRTTVNPGGGAGAYRVFNDVNGDGVINASDLVLVRNRVGTSIPSGAAGTSSAFDSDAEGWTTANTPNDLTGPDPQLAQSGPPQWAADLGNPGGGVRTADTGGSFTVFVAPQRFLGNRSAAYGRSLSYDLKITTTDGVPYPAIVLVGEDFALYRTTASPLVNVWVRHEVPLVGSSFTIDSPSGPASTEQQVRDVLASVKGFYINAEWRTGEDLSSLDNVHFPGGPASAGLEAVHVLSREPKTRPVSGWLTTSLLSSLDRLFSGRRIREFDQLCQ